MEESPTLPPPYDGCVGQRVYSYTHEIYGWLGYSAADPTTFIFLEDPECEAEFVEFDTMSGYIDPLSTRTWMIFHLDGAPLYAFLLCPDEELHVQVVPACLVRLFEEAYSS